MPPSTAVWRSARKAKSVDEINERYKVYKNKKSKGMQCFTCKRYQRQEHRCQFRVHWDEQSGKVWESGEHNHRPEEVTEIIRKKREWHYLTKADSFLSIRRQYLVRKSCDWGDHIRFQCIANRGLGSLQIRMEWKLLLKGKLLNSFDEVRRRYPVNKCSRSSTYYKTRLCWFKCCHCDGQKCDYTLRWDRDDGAIFWNQEQPCHRSKKTGKAEEKMTDPIVKFAPENIDHNKTPKSTPSPQLQFVEALNRDHKCHFRPMKLEAVVGSQHCKKFQILLPLLTIEEETAEETQSQAWHPHLKMTVKKEEPNDADEPAADFVEENVIDAGSKEAADQAPTKMLLRERKRQPNYAGK